LIHHNGNKEGGENMKVIREGEKFRSISVVLQSRKDIVIFRAGLSNLDAKEALRSINEEEREDLDISEDDIGSFLDDLDQEIENLS